MEAVSLMRHPPGQQPSLPLAPKAPHDIGAVGLTHGAALWVLRELGFGEGASESTFNYYIKSLRKLGVPFAATQHKYPSRRLALYSYEHLMELALALTLRVYGTLPDPVLNGLVQYRSDLNTIYRSIYVEGVHNTEVAFHVGKRRVATLEFRGVYLDLQIVFSGGRLVRFGPPRVIPAHEAIQLFLRENLSSRSALLIHVSELAEQVVRLARKAPIVRRGPPTKQNFGPSNSEATPFR
jgi:hypothetical protein